LIVINRSVLERARAATVAELDGIPWLGVLDVEDRERARAALRIAPAETGETERKALRRAGFKDREIWDIVAVTAFFNMTNRVAAATDMMPNEQYLAQAR
jgi:hypothetical protein